LEAKQKIKEDKAKMGRKEEEVERRRRKKVREECEEGTKGGREEERTGEDMGGRSQADPSLSKSAMDGSEAKAPTANSVGKPSGKVVLLL
jgi:hypothetical protein